MTDEVKVYALLTAKEGKASELEKLLTDSARASRTEDGNLRYNVWQDTNVPNRYVLDELYRDQAAADFHRASAHFKRYASVIEDLADRTVVLSRKIDVV
jgi:quinol monooxygenase YgiN